MEEALQEEILNPHLQARFYKLYPADFSVVIYLFLCASPGDFSK